MPKEFFLYALFGGHNLFCQERFKKHYGIYNAMMIEKMVHQYAEPDDAVFKIEADVTFAQNGVFHGKLKYNNYNVRFRWNRV